jgi:hypothetical protein
MSDALLSRTYLVRQLLSHIERVSAVLFRLRQLPLKKMEDRLLCFLLIQSPTFAESAISFLHYGRLWRAHHVYEQV